MGQPFIGVGEIKVWSNSHTELVQCCPGIIIGGGGGGGGSGKENIKCM